MKVTTNDDDEFFGIVSKRIMFARDEFFEFMKSFSTDLDEVAHEDPNNWTREWDCLGTYFSEWVREKVGWHDGLPESPARREEGLPASTYAARGTQKFEEFNQLLPAILLAAIDEAQRYPELLSAASSHPNGTADTVTVRTIPYLFTSKRERDRQRAAPSFDAQYDDAFAIAVLREPFPPVISSFG